MWHDIALICSVWFFCGLIAYGGAYAETSSEAVNGIPIAFDVAIRWASFVLGPVGLICVVIVTRVFRNGVRFR